MHTWEVPLRLPPLQVGGAPGADLPHTGAQKEALECGAMDLRFRERGSATAGGARTHGFDRPIYNRPN